LGDREIAEQGGIAGVGSNHALHDGEAVAVGLQRRG